MTNTIKNTLERNIVDTPVVTVKISHVVLGLVIYFIIKKVK